ncbi:MAG TPA: glycosyltransferase [Thermoanaerobaculia bacterium]|jgi:glycosyltransferase involved in cell wall biosynthesis|nr:glycosyltransferase [Thermoanaerobaculia bacterium]
MPEPLRLAWMLEDTAISAKARLVMAQADAMIARGHRARIVTTGAPVTWRGSSAEWVYVDDVRQYDRRDDDFVVQGALRMLIVDDELYRPGIPSEHEPPRVLLCGPAQNEGIGEGYGAVAHARWFHQKLDLIRVSPWTPSKEEPLDSVQEFHVSLTTAEMTRLVHSCDVLIAPNHRGEGFGLFAAEAMASGLACLLTSIPSFLSFDDVHDYAVFAPEANAVELGERLIELLSDASLRERLRARGREVAEQWRARYVADRLERFFADRRLTSTSG